MLRFFKFRQELPAPVPARDIYVKRPAGRGWPEECPPLRAAAAFGFDVVAAFDITFVQKKGKWSVANDIVIESDFEWSADPDAEGRPLTQQYAWFWEKGQTLPHVISDNVYAEISNQVKVSTFLFLQSDPNELIFMSDVPNLSRPFRVMSALVDTDWYPASYPWHTVLELDRDAKEISIKAGDPICRLMPVRRDTYFAKAMTSEEFDAFFDRGQKWLTTHGKPAEDGAGTVDITRTYVRQQMKSRFVVM